MGVPSEKGKKYFVEVTDATVSDPTIAFNLKFKTDDGGILPSAEKVGLLRLFAWIDIHAPGKLDRHILSMKIDNLQDDTVSVIHTFPDKLYASEGTSPVDIHVAINSIEDNSGNKVDHKLLSKDTSKSTDSHGYIKVSSNAHISQEDKHLFDDEIPPAPYNHPRAHYAEVQYSTDNKNWKVEKSPNDQEVNI